MKGFILRSLVLASLMVAGAVRASAVDELLAGYRDQGAGPFDASTGQTQWERSFPSSDGPRACTSCHTRDPRGQGLNAVTGKSIEPIAPSANAKRLTDPRQIEKWLKRNCKWTLGRECTPQEKGDLLTFLRNQ